MSKQQSSSRLIEDRFGGFGEVGVFGELRVLLRLLHALEEGSAVPAAKGKPRHRRKDRDGDRSKKTEEKGETYARL
ncbi:hypothetical protein BHM03_00011355 [Ensete ventricosum]|nr:hypothetical protein BHM03_00011355 [Ensete ventricosum]